MITVADYSQAQQVLDELVKKRCEGTKDKRSCGFNNAGRGYWKEDIGGALLWATWGFLERDAKITHMAWAWQDPVEGHELQLTNNADQSRTFAYVTMHQNRLYIVEGTLPELPAAGLVSAVAGIRGQGRRGVRYQCVYRTCTPSSRRFPGQAESHRSGRRTRSWRRRARSAAGGCRSLGHQRRPAGWWSGPT